MRGSGQAARRRAAMAIAIAVVSCVLLMGPVLLFGAFTLRTSLLALNARHDEERVDTANLAAALVARGMTARSDELRLLSARTAIRDAFARRDAKGFVDLVGPAFVGLRDIASVVAISPAGDLIARYPVDPAAQGQSFADRDYFVGALRTDGIFIGNAVTSRIDPGLVVVTLAHAVRDGPEVLGVMVLTVRPGQLIADLRIARADAGREIVLVDGGGGTLASTAKHPVLGHLGLPTDSASGVASVEGQLRVYASAALAGSAWTLYALDDPAVLYAAQRALLNVLGAPLAGVIVVAGILAALLASAWLIVARQRERLAAANVRLLAMNAEVQAATHAKSDFLANMSHELRTPLNAVLGFSDVLQEQLRETLSERQQRYLTNIHAAGQHLLELINDVLDLSKVEAGRLVLRPETVSLSTLAEPVIASATQLAADRGVRFDAPDVPRGTALVDPGRVRQILLNLLSNAVKFTPAGGEVRLSIAVEGGDLRFEVADTGIGIPADKRDRVFGMFERLHEGRSDASGTGLGLAITKKLVELHHGTIDFESREGQGTRFWLRLEDVMTEPTVGPRLLVVEDDARDAELLAQLAHEAGLRVEVAPTAASALAAIARSAPTAVILDLRLPDRRGEDVLRSLKADPATARVPVFVVSVEDDDGSARLLGASDHMTKPIDRERLRRWIAGIAIGGGVRARAAG